MISLDRKSPHWLEIRDHDGHQTKITELPQSRWSHLVKTSYCSRPCCVCASSVPSLKLPQNRTFRRHCWSVFNRRVLPTAYRLLPPELNAASMMIIRQGHHADFFFHSNFDQDNTSPLANVFTARFLLSNLPQITPASAARSIAINVHHTTASDIRLSPTLITPNRLILNDSADYPKLPHRLWSGIREITLTNTAKIMTD